MKKLYLLMFGLLACVIASAQTTTQPPEKKNPEAKDVSEGQLYYAGKFEKAANLGLNFRFGFVEFGGSVQLTGKGNAWKINLGGAYRYYLDKSIFVEGAVGVNYGDYSSSTTVSKNSSSMKVPPLNYGHNGNYSSGTETKETSESGFGAYVTPRVGVIVSNGWGIYAAYEWDFYKFKFDNFDKRGYWKLGIVIPF